MSKKKIKDSVPGTSAHDYQVGGSHYVSMAIQPSEFITKNDLGWCEGNAIKYICRHHIKGGKQDIDKAIHFLQLLKEINYSGIADKEEKVKAKKLPDPPF